MKVAFLGLGVMGFPMAGHLARAGHEVCVYNRNAQKSELWLEQFQGRRGLTPAEAAADAEVVALCVGKDVDVEEVVVGSEGVLKTLAKGSIIIDHTTTSSRLARRMAEASAKKGCYFIDAPVSGGEAGAQAGRLTAMVGGELKAYQRAIPVLEAYTQLHRHFGGPGKGQEVKMVNQTLIAGVLQGLSEGIKLAEACELDIPLLAETLSKGAAQSWQLDNRAITMGERSFNFGFATDHMIKDLGIVLERAQELALNLPLTHNVRQEYEQLSAQGEGRSDTSVLIKSLDAPLKEH